MIIFLRLVAFKTITQILNPGTQCWGKNAIGPETKVVKALLAQNYCAIVRR